MWNGDGSPEVLTVSGALRLARVVPILEVGRASFVEQVDAIIRVRGHDPAATVDDHVRVVSDWRAMQGPIQDTYSPEYFQSLAGGVALAVAGVGEYEDRWRKIEYSIANFWSTCDDLLHRYDGYRQPEFVSLKTTLRGVEDDWQRRDREVLSSGMSLAEAFEFSYLKVQAVLPRRRDIAFAMARCADWPMF